MKDALTEYEYWLTQHWQTHAPYTESSREFLAMAAMGLAGESGEVLDEVKKGLFYPSRSLDAEKIGEELGDVIHYWVLLAFTMGFHPSDILRENVAKLEQRYNQKSPDEAKEISEQI